MQEINLKATPICLMIPGFTYYFSSLEGASKKCLELSGASKPIINDKTFIDGEDLAKLALSWAGKNFNPGVGEQCAAFVRSLLKEKGCNIGVTKNPSDGYYLTGENYANSFSGDDIGLLIEWEKDLKPGDIVLFKNTYGAWPAGTITHVGIYTGSGYFVHRPTMSKPVQKESLASYGHFREGRRLYQ